jgi:hypothetical protein
MNNKYSLFSFLSLFCVCAAACGEDPVSYSEPVGLELKIESSKVVNGSISNEKSITTESGNPYGAFITAAKAELGREPSRIVLTSATLQLGASSTGVVSLSEIFDGEISVLFSMDTTNDTFSAATLVIDDSTQGRGPIEMAALFDSDDMSAANISKLLSGSFKVVLAGPTAENFDALDAKADVQVTLTLEAYE